MALGYPPPHASVCLCTAQHSIDRVFLQSETDKCKHVHACLPKGPFARAAACESCEDLDGEMGEP